VITILAATRAIPKKLAPIFRNPQQLATLEIDFSACGIVFVREYIERSRFNDTIDGIKIL
jgi:hypothetical protein